MEIQTLSLAQLQEKIAQKELSSQDIFDECIKQISEKDPTIQAFNSLTEQKDSPLTGPLGGIPIAFKDVFCEAGELTQASSKMLEGFRPPYSSTVVERLLQAGARSIGKTAQDEFAMGGSGENSALKITKNPHDLTRIPGGSSSGSAAAVASGMVPAALGTDTGGSIRQPASMCGVVGFKPSYGRNSRFGVIAMASSLDTPGTFTKTVEDAVILHNIISGPDPKDATCIQEFKPILDSEWKQDRLDGITIGVPKEYFIEGLDEGVKLTINTAIDSLRELGATIKEISLPHTSYGLACYYIICPAEVSSNMARYDGIRFGTANGTGSDIASHRTAGFGPEVQRRILLGAYVLSSGFYDAYYKKASGVRELIREDFRKAFEEVDAIVSPVAPSVAWKLGEKNKDPLKLYLEDIFTVPASLAGIPGMSLPVGSCAPSDNPDIKLPVGLQILGPFAKEEKVFQVAYPLEQYLKK